MRHNIKKGKHDASEWAFGIHTGTRSEVWEVEFNNTNLYEPLDHEHDWNKLCGWSYGMHHNNSIRAGWRPAGAQIELALYVYQDGVREVSATNILVPVNSPIRVCLKYDLDRVSLIVHQPKHGFLAEVQLPYSAKPAWGYWLYPYFGGNAPAPNDMFINLKRL